MPVAAGVLSTYDKVVGRAGALLSVRLGIVAIRTDLASELALEILRAHGVRVEAAEVCQRMACATEELLRAVTDPEEAYRIVVRRIEERSGA